MGNKKSAHVFLSKEAAGYVDTLLFRCRKLPFRNNVEDLHVLRTTSRRLLNLLWILKDFIPARYYLKWRQTVRMPARRTNLARDIDVHTAHLLQLQSEKFFLSKFSGEAMEKLLSDFQKQRNNLQPSVILAFRKPGWKPALMQIKKILIKEILRKRMSVVQEQELQLIARGKILKRLEKLLDFEMHVLKPRRVEHLHAMRIAAKRLRYTLESLRPLHSSKLENYYASVLTVHRKLGVVHDFDMWTAHLKKYASRTVRKDKNSKIVIRKLQKHYQKHRTAAYKQFVRAWRSSRRNNQFEKMAEYISHNG